MTPIERKKKATEIRKTATDAGFLRPLPNHINNGDESRYGGKNYFANYSKGLQHDSLGEVVPQSYEALLNATQTGLESDYADVPLAAGLGTNGKKRRLLTNPQAGHGFDLEGDDGQSHLIPPAPAFASAEVAAEMVELYWMALARDVHFETYQTNPIIGAAVNDLDNMSNYRGHGPAAGVVKRENVFRGFTKGDLAGPYISQFLLKDIPYGSLCISQKQKTATTNKDYMKTYADWLAIQNGENAGVGYNPCNDDLSGGAFEAQPQYIRNLRDLATYVHYDALYEAYLNACLILLGMNAPLDKGNPYTNYDCSNPYHESTMGTLPICNPHYHPANQQGFATFGGPHILALVTEVSTRALKAVWHQKWNVHRRLRPEAYGGRVHNHVTNARKYPIHQDLLGSQALTQNFAKNNTYLLSQAFPEGSPTHPSYGAGHACVAGACVTVLKAWFDESYVLPDPIVVTPNGKQVQAYSGFDDLTLGNELNKLAANIAIGRNAAGVHYWSDYTASVKLGEDVAISILREQKMCFNEQFYFSLNCFDGTTIKI